MKLSRSLVSVALALILGTAAAKNIANLDFTPEQIQNALLEVEQEEFRLGKREAKNVINLNQFIDDDSYKREKREAAPEGTPKNVFAAQLIIDDSDLVKRDGKNVFHANLIVDEASLEKRDSKNVLNINMVIDENDILHKRDADAKNVVNIHLIIDDDSLLQKRGIENVVNLSISVDRIGSKFRDLLDHALDLGYLIGDEEYTATSVEQPSDDDINVILMKDSTGCHMKDRRFNLKSLSQVLNTFKEKSIDPIIEAKDKFALPDSLPFDEPDFKDTAFDPIQGDIVGALVRREDLNLFSKYLRDTPDLYRTFESTGTSNEGPEAKPKKQILVLAPNNNAVQNLEKKPWQFPEDISNAKSDDNEDLLIQRNIMNFVESHIVETEAFDVVSSSKTVEFRTLNNKVVLLRNFGYSFKAKLEDSEEWSDVIDTEVLHNGAILTLDRSLIH